MSGGVTLARSATVATVTLSHAGKLNAMSRLMWRELRSTFQGIRSDSDLRCVVVRGQGGHFCAGGDISEYADFRFESGSLREFHEGDVWAALQAMLDCPVPVVAAIEGQCMGAGIEIASCCDIRIASLCARFGAPIARLGFPMAPKEARLVVREVGWGVTRQMLLEAAIFGAADMLARGFLSRVVAHDELDFEVQASVARLTELSPQAARLNKQALRAMAVPVDVAEPTCNAADLIAVQVDTDYAWADSTQHREGIAAFLEKRRPVF